jgi:hypothetical protein
MRNSGLGGTAAHFMFTLMKAYVANSFTKHKEIGTNMIHVQAHTINTNIENVNINLKNSRSQ